MSKSLKQWSVKYRPKTFEDFLENEVASAKAQRLVKKQDAHAILIHGSSGTGKTTLARIIANGLTDQPTDIDERNMADEKGIDTIRSLIKTSQFKPRGQFRVFILDESHAILGQSQSALLKGLEEPEHDRVVWILCTDKPHLLSPPLLNRLYKIEVERPSIQGLAKYLYRIANKEQAFPKYDKEKIKKLCKEVATISDRVPREALQLLKEISDSQNEYSSFKELIVKGVRNSTDKSEDKLALQVLMAIYSSEKGAEEKAKYLTNILYDKNVWGVMDRVSSIHHDMINHMSDIRVGAAFYHIKELQERKAVPDIRTAAIVGSKLVAIKNALITINSSIQHYVIPELIKIIYFVEESDE